MRLRLVKNVVTACILVILSLVIADLLLGAAAFVSPRISEILSVVPRHIADDRLLHTPNPAYPDHDAKGFRNLQVPPTAPIVTLGDSQTYGNGATLEQAWPKVLESLIGHPVYNMAFGGWGPVQSLVLWDEAATLQPGIVIEGLYSGNDLFDSYRMVYMSGKMPQLKTGDRKIADLLEQAEASGSIAKQLSTAANIKRNVSAFNKFRKSLKPWFAEHSKVYALFWRAKYEISRFRKTNRNDKDRWQRAKASAAKHPDKRQVFTGDSARTIFKSQYRLSAINLDDPRIREGQRVSLEALRRLQQRAGRDETRFVVLLIPTKELVFSEQARNIVAPSYHSLIRHERQFWQETKQFLKTNSIEYIDALPALQRQLETGPQPYRVTSNGHPNRYGYQAIAKAVHAYLAPD